MLISPKFVEELPSLRTRVFFRVLWWSSRRPNAANQRAAYMPHYFGALLRAREMPLAPRVRSSTGGL